MGRHLLHLVERRLQPRTSLGYRPVEVQLTLDAGPADQALKLAQGAIALRRAKLDHGMLEDLATAAVRRES